MTEHRRFERAAAVAAALLAALSLGGCPAPSHARRRDRPRTGHKNGCRARTDEAPGSGAEGT